MLKKRLIMSTSQNSSINVGACRRLYITYPRPHLTFMARQAAKHGSIKVSNPSYIPTNLEWHIASRFRYQYSWKGRQRNVGRSLMKRSGPVILDKYRRGSWIHASYMVIWFG